MFNFKQQRWLLILPLVAIAIMVVLVVSKPGPRINQGEAPAPLVRTLPIQAQPMRPFVLGYGRVQPKETWQALSEVTGRIIFKHPKLEQGQALPAGTLLLKVDPVDYELRLTQAEADLVSAQAELTRVQLNEDKLAISLKLEQQQLSILEQELARKQGLRQSGSLSQSAVDIEQRNVLAQRQRVIEVENSIKQFPSDLAVVQAKVQLAESRLEEAQRLLDKTQIVLPFNARISQINAELEQVVNARDLLVSAQRVDTMEIPVQVAMPDMRNFAQHLGLSAETTAQGEYPDIAGWGLPAEATLYVGQEQYQWQGKLVNVGESIDPQGNTVTLLVHVDFAQVEFNPAKQPPLINDMYVEVKVFGNAKPMLVVPSDAVHGRDLYLLDGQSRLKRVTVTTLFGQDGQVAVVGAVQAGDTLVLDDVIPAVPGMLLRPEPSGQEGVQQ